MRNPMPVRSNLHTHTCFCDGNDTPEAIVLAAIEQGMEAIGFSGHALTPIDMSYCMSREGTRAYQDEITRLKSLYGDRIRILCGLEEDVYGSGETDGFDYLIGSVHYVLLDGEYCVVDMGRDVLLNAVQKHCNGDIFRFIEAYFDTVATVMDRTHCDIVGHFDLITKYNQNGRLFDESDPRYLIPAKRALDQLMAQDALFEVNTGAMSRGYRNEPYPSDTLLQYIAAQKGKITLNADAHRKEHLMFAFDEALEHIRACGFETVMTMTQNGWESRKI